MGENTNQLLFCLICQRDQLVRGVRGTSPGDAWKPFRLSHVGYLVCREALPLVQLCDR